MAEALEACQTHQQELLEDKAVFEVLPFLVGVVAKEERKRSGSTALAPDAVVEMLTKAVEKTNNHGEQTKEVRECVDKFPEEY